MLDMILLVGAIVAFVRFTRMQDRIDLIATETLRMQRELRE